MQVSGCSVSVGVGGVRTESIPFSAVPSQSRLFIEYQEKPLSLRKYYPNAVASHTELAARIPDVLANYKTDRNALCDALRSMNSSFGAATETLENIEHLRSADCVAVVTGQQVGLFTGPLYSIYKALSAIKMAECLRGRGINAVPVFWMATEDHDLEEVSNAFVIDSSRELAEIRVSAPAEDHGKPVGTIALDASVSAAAAELSASLPETEFTDVLKEVLKKAWAPGATFGDAFGRYITSLLGKFGLIVVDPLNDKLKELAAPIYVQAIENSGEIVSALAMRGDQLVGDGYHAQVLVEKDYFPLFWQTDDGRRVALRKARDQTVQAKGEKRSFTTTELSDAACAEPDRFSPGVMLRPVVQDFLFPTLCYFGGGAEIAYFAQNSEVYRVLGRPVTPILHRQSFTVVEVEAARTIEKYGLSLTDMFAGERRCTSGDR